MTILFLQRLIDRFKKYYKPTTLRLNNHISTTGAACREMWYYICDPVMSIKLTKESHVVVG